MMTQRGALTLVFAAGCLFPPAICAQDLWSEVPLPFVTTPLNCISFVDAAHGCVWNGVDRIIFYTADNGETWTADTIPAPRRISKCSVVSDSTIWGWGYKGTDVGPAALLLSTDGGQSWVRRDPPDTLLVRSMAFLSDSVIWLAGDTHLWVSQDAGLAWQPRGAFHGGGGLMTHELLESFDDSTGFISGGAMPFLPQRTTDGGWTWEVFWIRPRLDGYFDRCTPEQFSGDGLCSFLYAYMEESTTQRFTGIVLGCNRLQDTVHLRTNPNVDGVWARAVSRENIWMRDESSPNVILRTTDGGAQWVRDTFSVPIENALYDLRGHRFVLGGGRMFRLNHRPSGMGTGSFPLAWGNVWQYRVTTPSGSDSLSQFTVSIRVKGDTVMPGGVRYWLFDRDDPLGGWVMRSSAGAVHYWSTDAPVGDRMLADFKISAGVRDSLLWNGYISSVAGDTVRTELFGLETVQRTFFFDGIVRGELTWADGFGYSRYNFLGDNPPPLADPEALWELTGCRIDGVIYGTFTGVPPAMMRPSRFVLLQNYPNPFNPSTMIRYAIPQRAHVSLAVFNTLGQQVVHLRNEEQEAGYHEAMFDAHGFPSGVYFYRLRVGGHAETRKCVVLH